MTRWSIAALAAGVIAAGCASIGAQIKDILVLETIKEGKTVYSAKP